jgi:hypothetical protein
MGVEERHLLAVKQLIIQYFMNSTISNWEENTVDQYQDSSNDKL